MQNQLTYEISAERMEHFRNLESDCKLLRRQLAESKTTCEKPNDFKLEWNDFIERHHYRLFQIDQYLASLEKRLKRLEDDAEFDRFLESLELED